MQSEWKRTERGLVSPLGEGKMEITFITPTTIRVRYSASGDFRPHRSWSPVVANIEEEFGVPTLTETTDGGVVTLESERVKVEVDTATGMVTFKNHRGRVIVADSDPIQWGEVLFPFPPFNNDEGENLPPHARVEGKLVKSLDPDAVYLGFGERIGLLDRRGRRLTNWTQDPIWGHNRSHDNMYQAQPAFMVQKPNLTWGLFLNCTWYSQFDIGASDEEALGITTHGGEIDYYLFYGPTPAEVVDQLTRLTGRPMLPPLWSFGYHQSRWSYMDEAEFRFLAAEFRNRGIPLDALHFDIDYMRGYRDFTWDPERFPDPTTLLAELNEQGIRGVTIVDPGVKHDLTHGYDTADDGVEKGTFIKNPDGSLFVGYCWPDAALFPDFSLEKTRRWWGDEHQKLLDAGVTGIWNDMNEPAIFDRPFSEGHSEQKPMPVGTPQGDADERTVHAEVHNLYGLLMGRATYEGLKRLRKNERPWILTRSTFVGGQAYTAAWMGDNTAWWEHLEASLPQLMSMGLVGLSHVGVDIGGFFDNGSADLYARWIELGAFYPFMRTHSAAGTRRQEPWSFGEKVEGVARTAIELRYQLLPYLYTLAHEAHRTGAPLFRPLSYDFPNDRTTYHLHTQAMVGPHLMIAPIVHPGTEHRVAYFPKGTWYDFHSGAVLEGGTHHPIHAPLERFPMWVRGGAVLPLGNMRQSTQEPLTELTVRVYEGSDATVWTWVEDDGISFDYQRGHIAETTITLERTARGLETRLSPRQGKYHPSPRLLHLQVYGTFGDMIRVRIDEKETTAWQWLADKSGLELTWEDDGEAHTVIVG